VVTAFRNRPKLTVYPPSLSVKQAVVVYPGQSEQSFEITPETLIGNDQFDPITVMLAGRRGRGKTAALTFLGQIFRDAYELHNVDAKVAANYNTTVANLGPEHNPSQYCNPYIVDDMMGFPPWADRLLVLIDEAAALFPRRRSTARVNVDFSTFMQQIRKRDVEVAFTTQFPGMLDDQLLVNIDLYCTVNMWPRHGWNAGKYIDIMIWDWHGQFTGRFTKPRIPPDGPPTWRRRLHNANKIFGQYNTKEVIGPLWATDHQRESMARQHWAEGQIGEPGMVVIDPPDEVATNLAEFILTLQERSFNIDRILTDAQAFDPKIRNVKDLAERIDVFGLWDISRERKSWIANWKGD
jgi:hypothetical protein